MVEFHVQGGTSLLLPPQAKPARTDGLWRTTCFELFLMPKGTNSYLEFNLSPSFAWAAYQFDDYRTGGRDLPLTFDPKVELSRTSNGILSVYAELDVSAAGHAETAMGLSAVIEETDGTKSYWSLAHPPGAPDFHHPACFVARLPAPAAQ